LLAGGAVAGGGVGGRIIESGFDLIEAGNGAGNGEMRCQICDENGVPGTRAGTGLVVEVDYMHRNVGAGGAEEGEQRDRVRAAADGDGPGACGDGGDGLVERVNTAS